jgi:KDO2-lipid IV(A) lauroyltransferase
MKKIVSSIVCRGTYGVLYCVSLVPMPLLYGLSSLMYVLAYHIVGYRKEVVIQNISRAFPEKNYAEVRQVVKRFYAGFTASFAEMIKSISIRPGMLDEKLIFIGLERLTGLVEDGKNVIACLGHCGNWEVLNYMPQKLGCDTYAVYKPLKSETANRLMIRLRSRFGMKPIEDRSVVRHMLAKNALPGVYLFLADQCPTIKDEQYRFELLNQPAYHFSGMEKLARKTGSAVVYLYILPGEVKGRYLIVCAPLIADAGTTREGEITRKYVENLTENIQEAPHGWLWSHRRWK